MVIKPFITLTFAFIYQFMIQRAFKFIVNTYLVEIGRPKYFLMRNGSKFIEFGDFTLKLIAEVYGGPESYSLGACETAVHRFLETR